MFYNNIFLNVTDYLGDSLPKPIFPFISVTYSTRFGSKYQ